MSYKQNVKEETRALIGAIIIIALILLIGLLCA